MIKNLGAYAHPPKGGTMKTVKGMPITGGKTEMTPGNAQVTPRSKQAASMVSAPPAPFKNPGGILAPTPAVMPYGPTTRHTSGLSGSKAPKHPPKQYSIKTQGKMVGVNFPGPKKAGKMTASATKGGHSLLYGD